MTTIEVGKFYKNQAGYKVEALAIRGAVVIGAVHYVSETFSGIWTHVHQAEREWTPWIDEPAIPWDSVPEWLEWWAVDKDGMQCFYSGKINRGAEAWYLPYNEGDDEFAVLRVPIMHRIPYTGDWRESLRQRPGKEGK